MLKIEKNNRFLLQVLFVVLMIIGFLFLDIFTAIKHPPKKILAKSTIAKTVKLHTLHITLSPSPFASPSPTLIPTPTIVYTGYCLNVPVLYYHHTAPSEIAKTRGFSSLNVDAGVFDEQMGYLASHGFTTIFAEDLVNALKNHSPLPPKSVVVTLDDSYDDVYSYAFQSAKKYNTKLTVFVPTGLLGGNSATNSYYTWGQLQEMVNSGLVEAENHTWSHYSMGTKGSEKDQYEIKTAEDQLQQNLGKHSAVFAYPYGTNATSSFVQQELAQFGFIGAFSTIGGTYQCDSFIFSLHRTRIGNALFPAYGIY